VKSLRAIGTAGGASLIAMALMLAPALANANDRSKARAAPPLSSRPVGVFTPAVSDPRLAAALARRGTALNGDFRFTPASSNSSRALRVAVRARSNTPAEVSRTTLAATSATPVAAIMPSSYNLGVSLGWRRFALSGDIAQTEDSMLLPGRQDSARVGMSYRANRRLTGRVAVAAERNEGTQRLVREDEAYSLDVGGAFSIARNVDVTGGVRYRIARDRLEVLQRDERRDSQAVYIGTAFRF
jgi:hypothetical protein